MKLEKIDTASFSTTLISVSLTIIDVHLLSLIFFNKILFFELEIKSHFSVVSLSMSMVGSVVGIGRGFVNIWELITSDDAATNDSLASISSDIRNLQRATVDTTFAHDILEQESVTINGSSSIVFRCNLEESSSAWILV